MCEMPFPRLLASTLSPCPPEDESPPACTEALEKQTLMQETPPDSTPHTQEKPRLGTLLLPVVPEWESSRSLGSWANSGEVVAHGFHLKCPYYPQMRSVWPFTTHFTNPVK